MSTAAEKPILSSTRRAIFRIFGVVLGLVGLILLVGGIRLVSLSGSWYYALIGISWIVAGVLAFRGRVSGLYLYIITFLVTLVWAL